MQCVAVAPSAVCCRSPSAPPPHCPLCSLSLCPVLTGRLRGKVRVRAVVDPETRRQVAAARLAALELDNYEEAEAFAAVSAAAADGAYEEEQDEEVEQGGSKGRKRKARTAGSRGPAAAAEGATSSKGERAAKAVVHRTRNLDYVIAEEVRTLAHRRMRSTVSTHGARATQPRGIGGLFESAAAASVILIRSFVACNRLARVYVCSCAGV